MRAARLMLLMGLTLAIEAGSAQAQVPHVVRLIANPKNDVYRFEPAEVTAAPNDTLVFRVAGGAPHSVVFEGEGMSPGVRGAFNNALTGRSGDLSSPLLTATGSEYRVVVPQVPSGRYRFYCLPHRAYDMHGALTIR
jgi:plastocyanin